MHHRDFDLQALALEGSGRWNAQASDRCDGDWCVTGQDQPKHRLVVRRVDLQAAAMRHFASRPERQIMTGECWTSSRYSAAVSAPPMERLCHNVCLQKMAWV